MDKSILVTGASSGIGFNITQYLANKGVFVFAGVRKEKDYEKLKKIENVQPIFLDVRFQNQIDKAYNKISDDPHTFFGVVNNAGIGSLGFLTSFTEEEMYNIFNVNTFGPWRITNTFLQLILKNKGRIVNIGSQGGLLANKLYGPYTMTKHALEAYSDSLREELLPFNVKVSLVQPGGIETEIGDKALDGELQRFERTPEPFREEALLIKKALLGPNQPFNPNEEESNSNRNPSNPIIVSEAVYDALFSKNPKERYLVGTHWEGMRVINKLIKLLLDENNNPKHNLTSNELYSIMEKISKNR